MGEQSVTGLVPRIGVVSSAEAISTSGRALALRAGRSPDHPVIIDLGKPTRSGQPSGRDMLLGAAGIGIGVAAIGGGVAIIGPPAVISAVRRVIDSATSVPETLNDQEPAQPESDP